MTGQVTVLKFSADFCAPCKMVEKVLPHLEKNIVGFGTVERVDVEQDAERAHAYNIRSVPTFVLVREGKEVDRMVGVPAMSVLEEKVKYFATEEW